MRSSPIDISSKYLKEISLICVIIMLLTSCEKNGEDETIQRKTVDDLCFELTYAKPSSGKEGIEKFTLRLGVEEENQDVVEYLTHKGLNKREVLYYLSFRLQDEIYIERSGRQIPLGLYHYERSYDVKPYRTIDLAFPHQIAGDFRIVIDSKLFDVGPIKMSFRKAKSNT